MLRLLIHHLEHRFHARDFSERLVYPFAWGLDYLGVAEPSADATISKTTALQQLRRWNEQALEESHAFFAPPPLPDAADFQFDGFQLTFPSAIKSPSLHNNQVYGRYFPAGKNDRAVIISPQWNAQPESHIALCHALNRFGISALRLSLPYHDQRRPPELQRADYLISANVGRTIQAVRQAVFDVRRSVDWLHAQGITRVGVLGSSIGSCVSWLSFIHDERIEAGVFNMVSSYFGDVVWRGVTTSHIRHSLQTALDAETAREVWLSLSPSFYADRVLPRVKRRALLVSARYDLTFVPDLSDIFIQDCRRHQVPHRTTFLPCGHYTIGRSPFKYLDAFHLVNFFRRHWQR